MKTFLNKIGVVLMFIITLLVLDVLFARMKKFSKKYKHTTSLAAVVFLAFALLPAPLALFTIALWQLAMIAMSRRRVTHFYNTVLSPEQIKEITEGAAALKELATFVPGLKELQSAEGGFSFFKKLPDTFKTLTAENEELRKLTKTLRKQMANMPNSGVRWIGNVPFVTDECAKALSSIFVIETAKLGENAMRQLNREVRSHQGLIQRAAEYLGMEGTLFAKNADGEMVLQKTALDGTTIPLPTLYMPQITELVFKYGAARQYATVYPLGAGTVKLPRLKAGEDDFGFLGVGTAGMSAAITEKRVTAELITFTANKAGGLIRIPTELEEDTFIQLGQFLARYIARQFAKLEDKTVFIGDGTATYANITGVGPYCVANPTYLQQLAATKTKPTDATLNDFRAMRTKVSAAVLANMAANGQVAAAYYLNPTLDALLVTFNTLGAPLVYMRATGNSPATLDGFPIRWIGVSQAYQTTAAPSTFLAFFGDLSFVYLGERGQARVEISREVFFATDELAMRALERIDVEIMAIDSMAALQTAAA